MSGRSQDRVQTLLAEAVALHRAGQQAAAVVLYDRVLTLAPGDADALRLSAVAVAGLGRTPQALRRLMAVLALFPDFSEAWSNLTTVLTAAGGLDGAVEAGRRALIVAGGSRPTSAGPAVAGPAVAGLAAACRALAVARHAGGRTEAAKAALALALALDPGDEVALNNLGGVFDGAGEDGWAERLYRRAASVRPDYALAHANHGGVLARWKRPAAAVAALRRAVALDPAAGGPLAPLALVLRDLDRLDEAGRALRCLYRLTPENPAVPADLGLLHQVHGDAGRAESLQRLALALDPGFADALANLGMLRSFAGDAGEAERWLERALRQRPGMAEARLNRGLLLLSRGALAEGWRDYGWRFRSKGYGARTPRGAVPWRGGRLSGRTLLVWREQGVGDEILFSSLYPELGALGGPVIVETDPRLVPLFARSFPGVTVRADSTGPGGEEMLARSGAHLHVAAGSLPQVLRPALDRFPGRDGGWLVPDPGRRRRWRERLDALGPGLRVGIAWRSSVMTTERRHAYTRLEEWGPLLALPGVHAVNLQYDDCAAEIARARERFGVTIHRWPDLDLRDDFDGTAALIAALDLVICPATAAGELAGALGVPVWRLGRSDWTRLGSGTRPWFPGMRLWAPPPGQPPGASLPRMAAALATLARTGPPRQAPAPLDRTRQDAVTLYRQGDAVGAERLCRALIAAGDAASETHQLLAVLLRRRGARDEAAVHFAAAAAADPGNAAALAGLAGEWDALGRPAAALAAQVAALAADPAAAASWLNLSARRRVAGLDARTPLLRALRLRPEMAAAWIQAGMVLEGPAGEAALRRALALEPSSADGLSNLGSWLRAADRPVSAEVLLSRAVTVQPGLAAAWTNLGTVRETLGRRDEAAFCHRRALELAPRLAEAQANLGLLLQRAGRIGDAEAAFAAAIAAAPDFAQAHHNRALLLLEHGALRPGWQEHEWRFATPQFVGQQRRLSARPWRGENIARARVLVWGEQGVGDEILFSSCFAELMARAGATVIECDPRLVGLLARSFPAATVRAPSPDGGGIDVQVAAGSLPRFLRPAVARFPGGAGWLTADAAAVARWRERLHELGPGLKVGIAWRSAAMEGERRWSYVSLAAMAPLFTVPGVVFIPIQYGDTDAEIRDAEARFGITLHRWPELDLKNDLDGAAALTAALDLVISPAMSGGELAGALGVPVWRFGRSDWTQLGTGVRPWFPAMRLFHPGREQEMAGVIPRMAAALRRLAVGGEDGAADDGGVDALLERAAALHRDGRLEAAAPLYARVLRRRPGDPVALHLSGLLVLQRGDPRAALPAIMAAVRADPDYRAAWSSLGNARLAAGETAGALAAFDAALALEPGEPATLTNRGNALMALGRAEAAVTGHRRALALAPGLAAALDNLGCALLALGDAAAAEAEHRRAALAIPDHAAPRTNRALALRRLGRVAAAAKEARRALALEPAAVTGLANAGRLLRETGEDAAAERWCDRALALVPDHGAAAFNRGVLRLARGDLAAGWAGYEARWSDGDAASAARWFDLPEWRGEELAGKRILVWEEQGVGDSLLFLSCLPALLARAGGVVVECEERLRPLLARSFPDAEVRCPTARPRDADRHVPAGSLARWLRPTLADFPLRSCGWLVPEPGRAAAWRDRVAALGPGLKLGIGWRSGVMTAERAGNYLPLRALAPLLAMAGVVPVSVQYGETETEIRAVERRFGITIHRWADLDLKDDLDGAAALMAALDLVVSPAMSAGELAGALGVPVWRFGRSGDWTRLGTGARPWFPTMRLFATPPGQGIDSLPPALVAALARLV